MMNLNDRALILLPIEQLYPHPDNPRGDVGDVSELADSIKAKGIMQNLTVVKGNIGDKSDEGYTVVIGHRRLAAARTAGLDKLPCVVSDMSRSEQVATMLLENMQRCDLTIYEQAQGFQMMLDLGETKASISEQTGFSRSTVDRRLKLLKLDKDKLYSAESRGGTLEDYIKVAEIKDEKVRNRVIDAIGTSNFHWDYSRAVTKQKLDEAMPLIKREMKKIGAKRNKDLYSWDSDYQVVCAVEIDDFKECCLDKKVKKNTEYWWNIYSNSHVYLFKLAPKNKKAVVKKSDEELKAIAQRKKLAEVTQHAYECRKSFVAEFSSCKKDSAILNEWLWELTYMRFVNSYPSITWDLMCEKTGEARDRYKYSCERDNLNRFINENPSNAPIVLLSALSGDSSSMSYYNENHGITMPSYKENKKLDMIYQYLCKLGYEMSDEEKALQNGTHELLEKKESETEE